MVQAPRDHADSVDLKPGGRNGLTPLYDIISAQPSLDADQVQARQMKPAVAVGERTRYRIEQIQARHFPQTAEKAGMPRSLVQRAVDEILAD